MLRTIVHDGGPWDSRLRARRIERPLVISGAAAVPNTSALHALSHISCGTALTSLARVAPAPSAASTAGEHAAYERRGASIGERLDQSCVRDVLAILERDRYPFFLKAHIHVGCRRELP